MDEVRVPHDSVPDETLSNASPLDSLNYNDPIKFINRQIDQFVKPHNQLKIIQSNVHTN